MMQIPKIIKSHRLLLNFPETLDIAISTVNNIINMRFIVESVGIIHVILTATLYQHKFKVFQTFKTPYINALEEQSLIWTYNHILRSYLPIWCDAIYHVSILIERLLSFLEMIFTISCFNLAPHQETPCIGDKVFSEVFNNLDLCYRRVTQLCLRISLLE